MDMPGLWAGRVGWAGGLGERTGTKHAAVCRLGARGRPLSEVPSRDANVPSGDAASVEGAAQHSPIRLAISRIGSNGIGSDRQRCDAVQPDGYSVS